jgi:hypothetical protein
MSKRNIPNLYIVTNNEHELESVHNNEYIKEIIFGSVILGIKEAIKLNKKEATIVELNSSGNCISIPMDKWKIPLEEAQKHYVAQEAYELCADIQQVIESINSYGTKRSYRKASTTDQSNNRNRKHTKAS